MIAKSVLLRPQDLRPRARAPTCPPPPCYATVLMKMKKISVNSEAVMRLWFVDQ